MTDKKERWILCDKCNAKLAKEESPGTFVTRLSRGKNRKTVIKIWGGTIRCDRCENEVTIPPIEI